MANATEGSDTLSHRLLSIELQQCAKLSSILFSGPVEYIYNPLEYAYNMHSNFVHKFCTSTKQILFLGMNPGPWGMSQTGVPFGEVKVVQDWLKITGHIGRPQKEHPSRQVLGLECKRSEVSGRKFWGLFQNLCRDPDIFFQKAFVYNYCPLAFMTNTGKNITPTELKASERRSLNEICDKALHDVLLLLQVEMIVAIGKFAEARANSVVAGTELKGKIKICTVQRRVTLTDVILNIQKGSGNSGNQFCIVTTSSQDTIYCFTLRNLRYRGTSTITDNHIVHCTCQPLQQQQEITQESYDCHVTEMSTCLLSHEISTDVYKFEPASVPWAEMWDKTARQMANTEQAVLHQLLECAYR